MRAHKLETDDEWDQYISLLEFVYNSTRNVTTGVTPHEFLYGFQPRGPLDFQSGSGIKEVNDFALKRLAIAKKAEAAMKKAQESQKKFYDQH